MSSQEHCRDLDVKDEENQYTHKDSAGSWVVKPKAKNVVTLTIERYASQRDMRMRY